jgi:glycosyltransferase involved in cell wall biosynthesis
MRGEPVARRVGINALFLQPPMGGLETYVRELVPALVEARPELEIVVYASDHAREALRAEAWPTSVEVVSHPLLGRRFTRAVTETTLLGRIASDAGLDLLHNVAITGPLRLRPANVVMVADMTWLHERGAVPRHVRMLWRALLHPLVRRASRVITLSRDARAELVAETRVAPTKVDVVPLATPTASPARPTPENEIRTRFGIGNGRLVLAVSLLRPHKNLARLLDAWARVVTTIPDARLVVAGTDTPYRRELLALADRLRIDDSVVFPGWVSASDLEGLYVTASCFVFPSLREGFGLPLLEAMARGVPVACSHASAIPEVAGDAALYFDPYEPTTIANAIVHILSDEAVTAELARKGRQRQRQFTWQRTATETLASFDRALANQPSRPRRRAQRPRGR